MQLRTEFSQAQILECPWSKRRKCYVINSNHNNCYLDISFPLFWTLKIHLNHPLIIVKVQTGAYRQS